jgi:hypothetical protein
MLTMKKNIVAIALSSALCPFATQAGAMGDAVMGESGKFLLIEAGADYMNAIYKNNVIGTQSYTTLTPNGTSYNPSVIYPNNFFGGYMGLSLFTNSLLFNARYDMYASKTKRSYNNLFRTDIAPAKLSFTLDKTWGSIQRFIYGVGAGVVISTHNEAQLFDYAPPTTGPNAGQIGFAFPGRTRLDPLVEAVVMYKLSENFNVRANVAYQIPEQTFYTHGHVNVNLGINYALPL